MSTGVAGPIPGPDLTEEIAKADLVVVGRIQQTRPAVGPVSLVSPRANPVDDELYEADVATLRSIAGTPPPGALTVLFLRGRSPARSWLELEAGVVVLLFLRRSSDHYVPETPTGTPILSLANLDPPSAGTSKVSAVSHELEQVILKADPGPELPILRRACALRASLRYPVDLDVPRQTAMRDPDRGLAWLAVALSAGQHDALAALVRLQSNVAWSPDPGIAGVIVQSVAELRAAAAQPQLAALMQSPLPSLALAAAMALRQVRSPAAEPDLIRGLDHPDRNVRYQALMGLAELNPSVGEAPSFALYRRNEAQYVQRWKRWARRSHARK